MVRMGLMALFGKEAMERNEITALGTKRGTQGIKKNVRDSLLGKLNISVKILIVAGPNFIAFFNVEFLFFFMAFFTQ